MGADSEERKADHGQAGALGLEAELWILYLGHDVNVIQLMHEYDGSAEEVWRVLEVELKKRGGSLRYDLDEVIFEYTSLYLYFETLLPVIQTNITNQIFGDPRSVEQRRYVKDVVVECGM